VLRKLDADLASAMMVLCGQGVEIGTGFAGGATGTNIRRDDAAGFLSITRRILAHLHRPGCASGDSVKPTSSIPSGSPFDRQGGHPVIVNSTAARPVRGDCADADREAMMAVCYGSCAAHRAQNGDWSSPRRASGPAPPAVAAQVFGAAAPSDEPDPDELNAGENEEVSR